MHAWIALCLLALSSALAACAADAPANGTCRSNQDCASGEACVGGRCTAQKAAPRCAGDEDCAQDERCDPGLARCVPRGDEPEPACEAGGSACASGLSCDTTRRACVECLGDGQCKDDERCLEGRCAAVEVDAGVASDSGLAGLDAGASLDAGSSLDAGAAPDAAAPSDAGVQSCGSDSACAPPSTVCEGGQCVLGCGQVGGLRCGTGTVCDTRNGRCVAVAGPCASDSACAPPRTVCESGQCVPGCGEIGGLQCSGSQVCAASTGRCEGAPPPPLCAADGDCNPPATVCDVRSGACNPGCGVTGCAAGEACNAGSGRCEALPAQCAPDALEENDSYAGGRAVTPGLLAGLTLCSGDDDYYVVQLGAGDTLSATATFDGAEGDLDLELLGLLGATVGRSAGTGSSETASYTAQVGGAFAVRTFLFADRGITPGVSYQVQITITPPTPPMCMPDLFEPNDAAASASSLPPGEYTALTACEANEDFYTFAAGAQDTVRAELLFSDAEGDIDLELRDSAGTVLARSGGVADDERLTFTVSSAGTYAIRTWLYRDDGTQPGNGYGLRFTVTPAGACLTDLLEPNDTPGAAVALGAGARFFLGACGGNDDFYALQLTAGRAVTLDALFVDAEGDVDLQLFDPSGTMVASARGVVDNERITYTPTVSGAFALRVWLYADGGTSTGNTYQLSLSL